MTKDDEIVRLRAALAPFGEWGDDIDGNFATKGYLDACPLGLCPNRVHGQGPSLGDLRRASAALKVVA